MNEKGIVKDHDDTGGFDLRNVGAPVPEALRVSPSRRRLRDLCFREIEAASGFALNAIGQELGMPRGRYGDIVQSDADYRIVLRDEAERRLIAADKDDGLRRLVQQVDPPGSDGIDEELEAMRECARVLKPLNHAQCKRVLDYLRDRYVRGDG